MSTCSSPTTCECRCGYRCGGPGKCSLPPFECLQQKEGHFVRDCEHEWGHELVSVSEHVQSVVCVKCGVSAIGHDSLVGP